MSVLAFLQNAYAPSEEKAKRCEELFAKESMRGYMQARRKEGLFGGGNYTGLTIKRTFGERVVDAIWWENASPKWGWMSHHKFPADMEHIRKLCEFHMPDVVLCFGAVARDALSDLKNQLGSPIEFATIIAGPHPACRLPDKFEQLREMNRKLLGAIDFDVCPHCDRFTTGGSHCQHCYKSLYEEVLS